MKQIKWGSIPQQIVELLQQYGPMTAADLHPLIDASENDIRKALARMATPTRRVKPVGQRRVHVSGWTDDAEGLRRYPRPIYSVGHGENRPKPRRKSRNAVARDYQRKVRTMRRSNFVFNLGVLV